MIGRQVANAPSPHTDSLKGTNMKVRKLLRQYTDRNYRFLLDELPTAWHFCICPSEIGCGIERTKLQFEISEEIYEVSFADTWTMNANSTGISLSAFTGGRVDNMALASVDGQYYLIWAFMDSDFNFAGFGLTKKPYSAFTIAGAVAKGANGVFTVTNGYQFTIGARICVRNQNGTAPMYEWNWGTITAVANTTITATMDNVTAYGTAINATAANGEILQWDKFRPYIVTTTSQTLYKPYYLLCGEAYVQGSTLAIIYSRLEPTRVLSPNVVQVHSAVAAVVGATIDAGRYIPLWAHDATFRGAAQDNAIGSTMTLYGPSGLINILDIQLVNVTVRGTVSMPLRQYAQIYISLTATFTVANVFVLSYTVFEGMRA